MRLLLLAFVAALAAGCGGGSGTYDEDANETAVRAVENGPFKGVGEVSVGGVRERAECPQAPSAQAGPCLSVDVMTELPIRNTEGELDPLGRTVKAESDFFVWLKRNGENEWVVTHTTYRPKGVPQELGEPLSQPRGEGLALAGAGSTPGMQQTDTSAKRNMHGDVTTCSIDFTQTFPEGSFHLFGTVTGFFTPAS